MKIKYILVCVVIFAILTISQDGCTVPENLGGNKSSDTNKIDPFLGGDRGLSIQFQNGSPPDEVFDDKQWAFDVELRLINVGEHDVKGEDVQVILSGINPRDFGKEQSHFIHTRIEEDIISRYKDFDGNVIDPPEAYLVFPDLVFQEKLIGNQKFPLRAEVCYSYQTNAQSEGCIRRNVLSVDDDAICNVNEEKKVHNSGAPIKVTKFKQTPGGRNIIRYIFTIKHIGSGRVFLPGTKCPQDANSRLYENKIRFKIDSNVADLSCQGLSGGNTREGELLLNNGERTIHCIQRTQSDLDFVDKVDIVLNYDYKEFTQKEILVKKST